MSKFAAWTAIDPTNNSRVYTCILGESGSVDMVYGRSTSPTQQIRTETSSSSSAGLTFWVNKWREKVIDGSYVQGNVGIFESPADTPAGELAKAFLADAVTLESFTSVTSCGGEFVAKIHSRSARDKIAAAQPVRVEDRSARFMPADGEQFARPNGEVYHSRFLDRHSDVMVLRAFRDLPNPINVLLLGPAGSGKTALAEVAHGEDLITINGHGDMTVAQLVGQLMPTADGGWRFVAGPLTIAMSQGRPLLIDEINKLPPEIMSVFHSVTDGRGVLRLDDRPDDPLVHAQTGFCLIGTLNPDGLGSTQLPEALTSRFPVQVVVTTDLDAAEAMGVDHRFIEATANLITRNQRDADAPPVWVPQMRELLATKRLIDAGMGASFAAAALLAQCPHPEDAPIVADVLQQIFGQPIHPLALEGQL